MAKGSRGGKRVTTGGATATLNPTAQAQQQQTQQAQGGVPAAQVQMPAGDKKAFKLASLALLLRTLSQDKVSSILNKFNPQDAQLVIQYMQMPLIMVCKKI